MRKVNLCAAAAPIITCASACFALSENSIPTAPALRTAGLWRKGGREVTVRGKPTAQSHPDTEAGIGGPVHAAIGDVRGRTP